MFKGGLWSRIFRRKPEKKKSKFSLPSVQLSLKVTMTKQDSAVAKLGK